MTELVSGCIVLYRNDRTVLKRAIESFLQSSVILRLFLVDNSPDNELEDISNDKRVCYIHNLSNVGFGAAHNLAINKAITLGLKYHFIINPDIYFTTDVISPMINYVKENSDVGMMMPEILYPDGSIQYLPKLLPSPFWLIKRKFSRPKERSNQFIEKYELRKLPREFVYNAPILSGCFTLLNLKAITEVGGYDDKFFMYFEDFDLSRRVHKRYKTIYYPKVSVYHSYEGGANKNFKLFTVFLSSAVRFFNKWGWFSDKERKEINLRALKQYYD